MWAPLKPIWNDPDKHEDILYIVSLFLAWILSLCIPIIPKCRPRMLFCNCLGVLNAVVFCRRQIIYLFCSALPIFFLMIRGGEYNCILHYVIPLGVLGIARILDLSGLCILHPLTNAILLLFTLRVIDFAQYVYHSKHVKTSSAAASLAELFFAYLMFFPGLWSGPIISPNHILATFLLDTHNNHTLSSSDRIDYGLLSPQQYQKKPSCGQVQTEENTNTAGLMIATVYIQEAFQFFTMRLRETSFHVLMLIPLTVLTFFLSSKYGVNASQLDVLVKLDLGLPSRIAGFGTFAVLFCNLLLFRSRFLVAWLISESAVVASGTRTHHYVISVDEAIVLLEDHPRALAERHKKIEAKSEKMDLSHQTSICRNYCSKKIELSSSLSSILRNWNKGVQAWLVRNIYQVYRPKSQTKRRLAVVAISAYWHGFHPGYYLAFLSLPFFQAAQATFHKGLEKSFRSTESAYLTHIIEIFATQLIISFVVVPFICQSAVKTLAVWSSLSHYGMILGITLWVLGRFMQHISPMISGDKLSCKTEYSKKD